MNKLSVSAGIVTYNNEKEIIPCLTTLFRYNQGMNMDVYVYDNASSDGTVDIIKNYFPEIYLIEGFENKGFGYGHNQILKRLTSTYHMVVNPDIQFVEGTVWRLASFMQHNPRVGIVTPKIKNPDGSEQCLPKKDPRFSYVVLSKFKPFNYLRDEYTRAKDCFIRPARILSSTGCFFMIRTESFRRAKGFDERFFMYFEDADLSRRVRRKQAIVFYPEVYVYHDWKRDNTHSMKGILIFLMSMMKYFWKWKRDEIND